MGIELDLSELAALRPIRTSVTGARPDDGGDSGCCVVTPTTGSDSMAPRQDGVETGCVTPTARRDGGADGIGCVTPTSAASALRPATVCPPAPRKLRPAKRKRCGRPTAPAPQRLFFQVPHDLSAVFVESAAADSPPFPPTKKIRMHVVW